MSTVARPGGPDPFADLNLCRRAINALRQAGIATPEQAAEMRESDLLALRCFGPASLAVLRASVQRGDGDARG
jgi:DNA-directed RNA polymerase alpha subunit